MLQIPLCSIILLIYIHSKFLFYKLAKIEKLIKSNQIILEGINYLKFLFLLTVCSINYRKKFFVIILS